MNFYFSCETFSFSSFTFLFLSSFSFLSSPHPAPLPAFLLFFPVYFLFLIFFYSSSLSFLFKLLYFSFFHSFSFHYFPSSCHQEMSQLMREHPLWKDGGEKNIGMATEALERCVLIG